ncbi:MAG: hypothetical protein J4G05_06475 [Chlorobi bacterium]|nr:hypothetical protein [Chlorobiota bacterium]
MNLHIFRVTVTVVAATLALLLGSGRLYSQAESYGTYGEVIIDEEYGVPLTDIAKFTGPGGTDCTNGRWSATCTEAVKGLSKSYGVEIRDLCFEIYRVELYTRDANGNMAFNSKVITTPVPSYDVNLKTDNPYEEVTFFVRRKRIPVQVEEKMENGADSPLGDGNSAFIVLPVTVGNATPPLPRSLNTNAGLSSINNPQHLADTWKYYVLCGSTVTFRAVAREPGVIFDSWNCEAGYTCDSSDEFQITATEDTKVQAIFKEDFRIVEIGLYQGSWTEVTWFSPDEWETPDDIYILDNLTTEVIIRFSRSVRRESIRGNILAYDKSNRIDDLPRQVYMGDCDPFLCATWGDYNGNGGAQLTLTLRNNAGHKVPRMMEVGLVIGHQITSTSGAPLAEGREFTFRMVE